MKESSPAPEEIAQRAYQSWEREGRPEGRALAHWKKAEKELRRAEASADDAAPTEAPTDFQGGPRVTNIDRALPPEERRRVRATRKKKETAAAESPPVEAAAHFVVTLNRARLRIYRSAETLGPSARQLEIEQSLDFPSGKVHYTESETDQAGQFPGSPTSRGFPRDLATSSGGSIDERLPMQEEHERRIVMQLAAQLDAFFQQHPNATWDYAAAPTLHRAVLDRISRPVRERIRVALAKDLVSQPVQEVCAQVADAQDRSE